MLAKVEPSTHFMAGHFVVMRSTKTLYKDSYIIICSTHMKGVLPGWQVGKVHDIHALN